MSLWEQYKNSNSNNSSAPSAADKLAFLNHDTIEYIADSIFRACQDDSNIASIKKLNVRLVEIEQAIENLWNALELGDAAERITKRINAREEEKAEIERQLAIERRKIKSFDYPRIHAFLEQMNGLNCANLSDRSKLSTMFIHTIFYYDDYLIIIMNGGKGLVTAENIPLKNIDNSLNIEISRTFPVLLYVNRLHQISTVFDRRLSIFYLLIDSIWLSVHKSCASDFLGCATN